MIAEGRGTINEYMYTLNALYSDSHNWSDLFSFCVLNTHNN